MSTIVVNKYKEPYDVDITRNGPFGNPFKIGEDGTREDVIEIYRVWFTVQVRSDAVFRSQVRALAGMRLGCVCKPQPCHGDVIVEYLVGSDLG